MLFLLYLLLFNVLGLLLMCLDKQFARHQIRRIPESVLLMAAAVGGSVGVWCGMYLFHHKTRKKKFSVGVPVILSAQLLILVGALQHGILSFA